MNLDGSGRWSQGLDPALFNTVFERFSPADPFKVSQWLKGADLDQCRWMVKYLWNQVSSDPVSPYLKDWNRAQFAGLVNWMLCGEGNLYLGSTFPALIWKVRGEGERYFARARNAWNQRVNRKRKEDQAANAVAIDSDTKRKIKKLAAEHSLKEEEFLAILIDLISERRGVVEGILQQRKKVKRAAIASDLGLYDSQPDKGDETSL
tara:strand:+ start:5417 stop:6034 length:618 start_codon:yes stop_codon:yes gene_type:complete